MSENPAFDAIFTELCREHGISSTVDLAIARLLALLLTEDQPDVTKITQLRAALPPRASGVDPAVAPAWVRRLHDSDLLLLDALVACGEAAEDPEKPWDETRGLVYDAILAHPAAEGLRSRLQLSEELVALSPTEMLFVPLIENLPRKEGGGWSQETKLAIAAEAKRLLAMVHHTPGEAVHGDAAIPLSGDAPTPGVEVIGSNGLPGVHGKSVRLAGPSIR